MGTFRHTSDGDIIINTTRVPLAFFVSLYPTYALPATYLTRYYDQSLCHYVGDGGINTLAYSIPYTDGDTYITNEAVIAAAYAASILPTISLAQAKTARITQLIAFSEATKKEHVIVGIGSDEFFSDNDTLQKLTNEDLTYTRAAALPVGYYVNDVNYVPVAVAALADLEDIIDRIVELHYLCDVNTDTHRAAINALAVISDVQTYDFSGGWPTTPY